MCHGTDGTRIVFHSKVHIASPNHHTGPTLLLSLLCRTGESLHNQVLGVVVAAAARAEFREHTAILEQSATLPVCLLFLIRIVPVLVGEHEIRLAGQRQQRDFVQDRVEPETLDDILHIAFVVIAACILFRDELDLDLLGGSEAEGL